jgi:predicted DCC family thiol-disulfide oxidoreductase YuxK
MSSAANQLDEVEVILDRETEGSRQLDVWMDGACGLCLKSREWCELRDHDRRLTFNDFRSARESDLPVSPQDLENSMWVRDGEGNLLEGFAAWRRIMGELPRWRWLARLTSLPPFTLIGPALYRLVAANRRHIRWSP